MRGVEKHGDSVECLYGDEAPHIHKKMYRPGGKKIQKKRIFFTGDYTGIYYSDDTEKYFGINKEIYKAHDETYFDENKDAHNE